MNKGKIVSVAGPVVDVAFETADVLPNIKDALVVKLGGEKKVMEVSKDMGDSIVRCIMLSASEGLRKGLEVFPTGGPISVPVGEKTLGRMFNVLGEPIDDGGPGQNQGQMADPPRSAQL